MTADSVFIHHDCTVLDGYGITGEDLEPAGLRPRRTDQRAVNRVGLLIQINRDRLVDDDTVTRSICQERYRLIGSRCSNRSNERIIITFAHLGDLAIGRINHNAIGALSILLSLVTRDTIVGNIGHKDAAGDEAFCHRGGNRAIKGAAGDNRCHINRCPITAADIENLRLVGVRIKGAAGNTECCLVRVCVCILNDHASDNFTARDIQRAGLRRGVGKDTDGLTLTRNRATFNIDRNIPQTTIGTTINGVGNNTTLIRQILNGAALDRQG